MRILLVGLLLGLTTLASCTPTLPVPTRPEATEDSLPIPVAYQTAVERAEAIGPEIYLLDKAAAIATDELLKHVPDLKNAGIGGYIPIRETADLANPEDSFLVFFYTRENPPRIAYTIRVPIKVDSKPEFEAFDPPKVGASFFLTLVRARQAAIAALPEVTQPLNPVLLPGAINGEQGILVYLLAGTKMSNIAVFGKHFRVLVSEDGTKPIYVMPLSKSSLEMSTVESNGTRVESLGVTHLIGETPLETHVFISLLWHLPVYVITKTGAWRVDGNKISLISNSAPKGTEAN